LLDKSRETRWSLKFIRFPASSSSCIQDGVRQDHNRVGGNPVKMLQNSRAVSYISRFRRLNCIEKREKAYWPFQINLWSSHSGEIQAIKNKRL